MENYSSNSIKKNDVTVVSDKKIIPKANGTIKKKSEAGKLAGLFVSGDFDSVKEYIFTDVLIPTIKNAISEMVRNGIDILLYGEARKNNSNRSTTSKVSYTNYYNGGSSSRNSDRSSNNNCNYDDIIFPSRGDAEVVLDGLNEIIQAYGFASVADLYELANITSNNYTYTNYGWTEIINISPARVPEGYILRLPRVTPFMK